MGYKLCKKGEVYYICVGGCNNPYNGGGRGNAGWGGGATHIATKTGELKTCPETRRRCCLSRAAEAAQGRPTARAAKGGGWYGGAMAEHRLDPVQAESIKGLSDKVDKATGIGRMAA